MQALKSCSSGSSQGLSKAAVRMQYKILAPLHCFLVGTPAPDRPLRGPSLHHVRKAGGM